MMGTQPMYCKNQKIKHIYAVLQTIKLELEQASNYVERIFALQNSAAILKMVTGYHALGKKIELHLMVPQNLSHGRISAYHAQIQTLVGGKIHRLKTETALFPHSTD
jgi:hypothetical protein